MSSGVGLSPEQRSFQLRLAFGFFFLLTAAYAVMVVGEQIQLMLFGSTAQADVVSVSDACDSRGRHVISPRVDYDYYDGGASVHRRGMYWVAADQPWPARGQTIDVEYVPGWSISAPITGESRVWRFWPVIPPLVLGGLLFMSWYYENAGAD